MDARIVTGWYGKIYGDLRAVMFEPDRISVRFVYFLNPDGTRNVEHDPERFLTPGK